MSMADRYTRNMYNEHRMFAAWPPNENFELGDFGIVEGRTLLKRGSRFIRYGNISTTDGFPKIQFKKRPISSPKSALTYASSGSVKYTFNPSISTGTSNDAKGDLDIKFSKVDSIFFYAENITIESIEDKSFVFKQILSHYKQNLVPKDFVLVADIVKAGNTTVYISGNADASVCLDAKVPGDLNPTGPINFGNAGIQLGIRSQTNIAYELTSMPGLTPFISLYGIHDVFDRKMKPLTAGSLLNVMQYDSMTKDQATPTVAFVRL